MPLRFAASTVSLIIRSTDGWIRFVHMRDLLVHPVDRQRELNQIVGADAEEIDFLRQHIRDQHGGRHLDHDADLNVFRVRHAFRVQFALCIPCSSALAARTSSTDEISGYMILTLP